ncbi:MAG: pyrroline-5-carboxylate reductase [Acidobacteriota bacterium]
MKKINLSKSRVAFLGLGTMGGILLESLLKEKILKPKNTVATVKHLARAKQLSKKLGISVTTDNVWAAGQSDLVMLCVKPHTVGLVAREIASEMTGDKLVVSIAASISTRFIEKSLEVEVPVIRAMPNTPCVVRSGMTGICKGKHAREAHLEVVRTLFGAVGTVVAVDEKQMDAVTGLSGSGPAFIYIILESLADAGVKVGLPRDVATLLAAQTVQGAARMSLETGQHPALLKDAVTTPAGCTIEGILALEEGKLRVTLINAIVKATERARELAE